MSQIPALREHYGDNTRDDHSNIVYSQLKVFIPADLDSLRYSRPKHIPPCPFVSRIELGNFPWILHQGDQIPLKPEISPAKAQDGGTSVLSCTVLFPTGSMGMR